MLKSLISFSESSGGALVSLIYGYTDNGDPFVRKFTDQLLEDVRVYDMICWKYHLILEIFYLGLQAILSDAPEMALCWRTP
jgi:hypothetical protein